MNIKRYFCSCIIVAVSIVSGISYAQETHSFRNPDLPAVQRINTILSLLTIDEKIKCLGTDPSVPRLGIKASGHVEGLHGLAQGGPARWGPDSSPVATTQFPQAYGLGETWDPDLVKLAASIEGYEARYVFQNHKYRQGGLVVRAPNADLGRDPRWGRTEECYGEDPFFNGVMAAAFSKGLQGDHPDYWQTASLLKHFLANSNEDGRDSSSSDFDEKLWREYYSVPFRESFLKAGAQCYMASYNAYNKIPATIHPMHKEISMKEWNVNGIICTDGGAYGMLVDAHHYYPDRSHAAAGCIQAGISQFLDKHEEGVRQALKDGLLSEEDIDKVLYRNFYVMLKLGLLDPPMRDPYSSIGIRDSIDPWTTDKHKGAARLITQKSIVLLKNDRKILPLNTSGIKSIAVIGKAAIEVYLGWYSGDTAYAVTPLEGIRTRAGNTISVRYADLDSEEALNLARTSDIVIVCAGNHPVCNSMGWKDCPQPGSGKEAVDRKTLDLDQEAHIKKIFALNRSAIVVLISSFPYAIRWTQKNVPAIVHMTHNSQEEGSALADVLFGDVNPAGRLTQTWPAFTEHLPPMMDYNIRNGRTYKYYKEKPLYPFGFGLSYSSFEYSNIKLSTARMSKDGKVTIQAEVKNTSSREGDEVVQLYVKQKTVLDSLPLKELKGFKRITIKAGEIKQVQLMLEAADLVQWDSKEKKFIVPLGTYVIMLGSSSADIRLTSEITVE